jgi:hypothetical protein
MANSAQEILDDIETAAQETVEEISAIIFGR